MDGRKVLTRYYPPDYDPDQLRQASKRLQQTKTVKRRGKEYREMRVMWPFHLTCFTCNEVNWTGTKINVRAKCCKKESYLGIPIWYFYAKCGFCRGEIVFRTDPKSGCYEMVSGGRQHKDPHDVETGSAAAPTTAVVEGEEEAAPRDAMEGLTEKAAIAADEVRRHAAIQQLRDRNLITKNDYETIDGMLDKLCNADGNGDQFALPAIEETARQEFAEAKLEIGKSNNLGPSVTERLGKMRGSGLAGGRHKSSGTVDVGLGLRSALLGASKGPSHGRS